MAAGPTMTLYGYISYESMPMLCLGDDKSMVVSGNVNPPLDRCFNIKTSSCKYMNSHYRDNTFPRPSQLVMGVHILVRRHLNTETGPRFSTIGDCILCSLIKFKLFPIASAT